MSDDGEDEDEEMHDAMEEIDESGGEWSPSTDTVIPPLQVDAPMAVDSATNAEESRPASASGRAQSPDVPKDAMDSEGDSDEGGEKVWKRFEVLSSAPPDHAFYSSVPAQPSRNFMTRLTKEYKALQSSLPGTLISFLLIGEPAISSLTFP